jgi:peptide/nickel transport system ATP-binding protein
VTGPLVTAQDLSVRFRLRDSIVQAVTDASFDLRPGRLLALVGESGCGKSVLASALLGLLPGNAEVRGGVPPYARSAPSWSRPCANSVPISGTGTARPTGSPTASAWPRAPWTATRTNCRAA